MIVTVESEKRIEAYLFKRMRQIGGSGSKFVCPNHRGKPDRLCAFKHGLIIFVELKSTGKVPDHHQLREHERMREQGLTVEVIDTKHGVDNFIHTYTEVDNAIRLCECITKCLKS